MMRLISNSEPTIHRHTPSKTALGEVLSYEELRDFAVQSLIEEYQECNIRLRVYDKKHPAEPDFSIISGGTAINILLVYQRDFEVNISSIDTSRLIKLYHETGVLPRLVIASSWCFAEKGKGQIPYAGEDFCFQYHPVSLLPDEENKPFELPLDHNSLVKKYADMWMNLNASEIADYLDAHFHYQSAYVFDEMASRREYLAYITDKLVTIKNSDSPVQVQLLSDEDHQFVGVLLTQNGCQRLLTVTTKDGYITRVQLNDYEPVEDEDDEADNVVDEEPMDEFNGDRNACITDLEQYLEHHVQSACDPDNLFLTSHQDALLGDEFIKDCRLISFADGKDELSYVILLCWREQRNSYELVTIYPWGRGERHRVRIERIREWSNKLEAIIEFSIADRERTISFFATDYHAHKHLYQVGQELNIELSAFSPRVDQADAEFQLEGDAAIKFSKEIGNEPGYDEKGEVKPIRFSTSELVAYIDTFSYAPDRAEFQSPVKYGQEINYHGEIFIKCPITIHTEPDISIPLYFRRDLLPEDVSFPMPMRGILYLQGRIAVD